MSVPHLQELADAVRAARVSSGYPTQKALAAATGLSPKTIQNLENGSRYTYSLATLDALDKAFGWKIGSASELLHDGTPPEYAEEIGGPSRLAEVVRRRMQKLGLSSESKPVADAGLTENVLTTLSSGRLPEDLDPTRIEAVLQWETGDFSRVLVGYEPRELPPDLASSASCNLMIGAAETVEAAHRAASAISAVASYNYEPLQALDTQSRMFAVAWLLGSDVGGFDLLNGRQYQTVLRTLSATFEVEVSRLQMADARYTTEPTPSGFTRAEIDQEMLNGGSPADAIRRLGERQSGHAPSSTSGTPAPTPAHDLGPSGLPFESAGEADDELPDFTALAARTVSRRPGWDASQVGADAGEEPQD